MAQWLDTLERFFADITENQTRSRTFKSVDLDVARSDFEGHGRAIEINQYPDAGDVANPAGYGVPNFRGLAEYENEMRIIAANLSSNVLHAKVVQRPRRRPRFGS